MELARVKADDNQNTMPHGASVTIHLWAHNPNLVGMYFVMI